MAGYVTLFVGRVYECLYPAKVAMPNGIFAHLVDDGNGGFEVEPITSYTAGDKVYFLENEYDMNWDVAPVDMREFMCRVGMLCRMYAPQHGGEVLMSVDQALFDDAGTIAGAKFAPAATGTVAAAADGPLQLVEKVSLWGMPALRLRVLEDM